MKSPLGLLAAVLVAGVAFTSACSGPTFPAGVSPNQTQAFFVHALTGSPLGSPTALEFPARSEARVDGNFSFDVAFDIDSHGFVVLLPPGLVGQSPSGNRLVGIVTGIGAYDAITAAPLSGYTLDSTTTVRAGQAAVIQAQEPLCLAVAPAAPYLYAKIVVDSVDYVGRGIYGRALITGDCGYRQLVPGYPTF